MVAQLMRSPAYCAKTTTAVSAELSGTMSPKPVVHMVTNAQYRARPYAFGRDVSCRTRLSSPTSSRCPSATSQLSAPDSAVWRPMP